ncbi:NAD-dependent epimerase/dehydratase family protein [Flavobacterium rhizosphaerae]|uniref:NAD-dependent epimerase/dehydratase family protein n=1 Tax=Flavobacterium rhizosphaerae TaxID=3163298 RepID=A0ABW8Z0P4_9FLAO
MENKVYNILITGTAGFIGFHLAEYFIKQGHNIVGIDSINEYYDSTLKYARLSQSGIDKEDVEWNKKVKSSKYTNYRFIRMNLEDKEALFTLCNEENFDVIVNMAAQAGVRYSIENPDVYVQSNVVGFLNILEAARHYNIKKLVYASSSSVYGNNKKMPFTIHDNVDHPVSLYAATKKSNELMAHTYSHLFGIKTVGLRFFTVYGPWGRPDMAISLFTDAVLNESEIKVFNNGNLSRDFTYIDDIVKGVVSAVLTDKSEPLYEIYNIGNSKPVQLTDFIEEIEKATGKKAIRQNLPMQPGDVASTWADVENFKKAYNYEPSTDIVTGIAKYVEWHKSFYKKQ